MAFRSSAPVGPDDGTYAALPTTGGRSAFRRLLRLVGRRKWFLVAPVALAVAITGAVLTQIVPEYGATAVVVIETSLTRLDGAPAAPSGTAEPATRVVSDADYLQSVGVLGQAVDRLGLERDPEFGLALPGPAVRAWAWGRTHIQEWLGATDWLPAAPVADSSSARARAVSLLTEAVSVSTRPPSMVIGITVRSRDKAKAQRIADAITDIYVKDKTKAREAAAKRAADLFEARLAGLRRDSEEAERALADYRTKSGLPEGDSRTTATQTLSELNSQLNQARTQTAERESRLKALQRAQQTPNSSAGVAEILNNPVITGLQLQETEVARKVSDLNQRYGDKYPKLPEAKAELAQIQGRIAAEVNRIAVSMQGDVDAARAKEAQLKKQVDEFEAQVSSQRQADGELRRLQREADIKRQAYSDVLKREGELRERIEGGLPEVRAMSAAVVSSEPVYPKYTRTLYFAAIAGLLMGIAWIAVLERLDSGFRSTEQIEAMMGVPLVGMIPLLPASTVKSSPVRSVLEKPMSVYSEALRLTYTAVSVSANSDKTKVVMITSSVPGEGKSTFACSYATLVARSNPKKRILLIDCDLRRSAVADLLGVRKIAGSIDQYLAGRVPLDRVFGRVEESGLYYIAAQSNTPNSAELLSSKDMQAFVTALCEQFDLVILDTPPIMAVSDPRIVARLADYIVFLVRWEKTERDVAMTAVKLLREVSDKVGVVLSQVDLKRHAKYGFSDYAASYSKYRKYYVS